MTKVEGMPRPPLLTLLLVIVVIVQVYIYVCRLGLRPLKLLITFQEFQFSSVQSSHYEAAIERSREEEFRRKREKEREEREVPGDH